MNNNENDNDTYGFISDLSPISSPRGDHLRISSFPGDTGFSQDDVVNHDPSSLLHSSGEMSVESTAVYMVSLSDDDEKDNAALHDDVFHTPPEQSSLPTSSDGVENCKVNQATDANFVETESVELGADSDLGFQEVEFSQLPAIERESLSQKDYSGKSPLKKLKLCEKNLGFGYRSLSSVGIESQNVVEEIGEMAICKGEMVSDPKNPCDCGYVNQPEQNILVSEQMSAGVGDNACGKKLMSMETNLASQVQSEIATNVGEFRVDDEESVQNGQSSDGMCEAGKLPCSDEGKNKQTEQVVVDAERQNRTDEQLGLRKLPASIHGCVMNAGNKPDSNTGNGQEGQKGEAAAGDVEKLAETGEICEAENLAGSGGKVTEVSGNQKRADKQLGCSENAENTMECEKSNHQLDSQTGKGAEQGDKASLFAALKVLKDLETTEDTQLEHNLHGLSLLDVAMSRGVKFPRPRWWSEKRRFGNQK